MISACKTITRDSSEMACNVYGKLRFRAMTFAAKWLYSCQCTFISLYFLLHFYTLCVTASVIT